MYYAYFCFRSTHDPIKPSNKMKNDFILHVLYDGDYDAEDIIKTLLSQKEIDGDLISAKRLKENKEVFYRIRIKPLGLGRFKKLLDKAASYRYVELFEFRLW